MTLREALEQIRMAADYEYGVGYEDQRAVMREARKEQGKNPEGPKMKQMLGAYRTPQVIRSAVFNNEDPYYSEARREIGIPIMKGNAQERIGSVLGALGADLTQDGFRRFYWLLNAPQATAEIATEAAIDYSNPRLYDKGRFRPGTIAALSIPTGAAINTALGLMTPFGGAEGYKALFPSQDNPTVSENILGEVAVKYLMGRTGNLLPYDEFVKVRPDVSREEYNRYKAFKFDKRGDIDPRDGAIGLPMGILKATDEGIHGPEVQFLGRSIPATTGLVPYATALAGTIAGVRSKQPIRRGFVGGLGGLGVGMVAGNLLEAERRRRNAEENKLDRLYT
jgi:hypothetical protein